MPYYPFTKNAVNMSLFFSSVFVIQVYKYKARFVFLFFSKEILHYLHLVMKSVKSKSLNPNYIGNSEHELGASWT